MVDVDLRIGFQREDDHEICQLYTRSLRSIFCTRGGAGAKGGGGKGGVRPPLHMTIVHVCAMTIVDACTVATLHACAMANQDETYRPCNTFC